MAQGKQPVINIEDLQPNDNPAGYRATWQEGSLIAYAQLLPLDSDPRSGYLLECNYDTATGREPTNRQIDAGTTLTSKVRELMVGQLVLAGWRMVDAQHETRKNIWQHSSRLVPSIGREQEQEELVHVTLADYTVSPYIGDRLRHNYQSVAIQGDVQALVVFWPYQSTHYLLQTGVDRNPFTGEPITPSQEQRARALLPALLDQVHAALVAAGWHLIERDDQQQQEIWHVSDHFSALASPAPAHLSAQSQAVLAPVAPIEVAREDDQAALPSQRILSVPARGRVSGYRRTITAHPVTYTCLECGQETTRALYPGAAPRYCESCANKIRRAKTLARVQRLRTKKREKPMRQIILEPGGVQIPVVFDQAGTISVEGVPVRIIEVTDVGGVLVQARAQVAGKSGGQWTERRTYILSGAQFWELVSGQPVADVEQAGLIEAKRLMAEGNSHDQV